MGTGVAGKALNAIHQHHAQSFAMPNSKRLGTLAAEPEVLHGMPVGRLLILLGVLLEAKKTAMPAIEI
jgi:hypothetical protein